MKTLLRKLIVFASFLRLAPLVLIYRISRKDIRLAGDLIRWSEICLANPQPGVRQFVELMVGFPEFRNLFYYRVGLKGKLFSCLCRPMDTLYIPCYRIGPGLFIQHGFSTIIAAKEIGRNCWINQQVTIGFADHGSAPVIGDNVVVGAGAKVIGDITVGDNSKIGANAVVVKNVPPDCTVVGVPARVVRRNGKRVSQGLLAESA